MTGRLDGRVAVITGGASGIGRAMAELFHREGARVVVADISGEQETVAKQLGDGCLAVHADVTSAADVEAMITAAQSTYGRVDVLCNNAGIEGDPHPVGEHPEEAWKHVVDVNLNGVFLGMRYGIPAMLATGGGSVVNMASMAAMVAFPQRAAYTASKAGVVMLTKTAAVEYASAGVRVNAICPGVIRTPLNEKLPPELIDTVKAMTPMARIADPDEVARVALFLASDDSSFVTGESIVVDGGYTLL